MTQGAGRKDRTTGTFGSVDKRATGYRARYYGPDGRRHQAPTAPAAGCARRSRASARATI